MSSLREVKDRIASVRSTLKITSAMKLVASSKLRKAQRSIEALRPYERTLAKILAALPPQMPDQVGHDGEWTVEESSKPTIVIAISSNTSMCGAFNANVIKKALDTVAGIEGPVEVWAFGRKMVDAFRKAGMPAARDYTHIVTHPASDEVADISRELRSMYDSGQVERVILVYNHFVSTGKQTPVAEGFLPFERGDFSASLEMTKGTSEMTGEDNLYILEPSAAQLAAAMIPQVLDLKLFAAILDSAAAEHAARMIAMQAATDNAEELLSQLTLEYNKGRQQKITSEILDIVGGSAER